MRQHTPGPWEWWSSNSYYRLSHNSDGDVLYAYIATNDGHPCVQVGEADRALIAAAPELFEALEAIVTDLPINRDWLNPDHENMAYAAIAKAKGES